MSASSNTTAATPRLDRILQEGYGPGAWHGPDLKAALADVGSDLAFWRPSPSRHNIAEIALHHAYFARQVRGQLTGEEPGVFVLEGEEWFALPDGSRLSWRPPIAEPLHVPRNDNNDYWRCVDTSSENAKETRLAPPRRADCYRAGSNNSMGFPSGSSIWICLPPGPVSIKFRKCTSAFFNVSMNAGRSLTRSTTRFHPPGACC
jgi:hypothetical protein